MKRERENEVPNNASDHFEILRGLSKKNSEEYQRVRDQQRESSLHQPSFLVSSTLSPSLRSHYMMLVGYLSHTMEVGSGGSPATIETVQLIANDGTTLIAHSKTKNGEFRSFSVLKEVGDAVIPGDVVFMYPAQDVWEVELVTVNAHLLTSDSSASSVSTANDAARRNGIAALQWITAFLSESPGLAQLTFIYRCAASSYDNGNREDARLRAGWLRLLNLSAFIRWNDLNADITTKQLSSRIEKTVFSSLRILIAALVHAHTLTPLPHLMKTVLHELIASPLFVDGFRLLYTSEYSASRADLEAMMVSLHQLLQLVLPTFPSGSSEVPEASEEAANRALCAVTYHLSNTALHQEKLLQDGNVTSTPLYAALELLVVNGATRQLIEWLKVLVMPRSTLSGISTTESLLAASHVPPTLPQMVSSSSSKGEGGNTGIFTSLALKSYEMLRKTYVPYRTYDAKPFVNGVLLSAYAELYGPAAAAVEDVVEAWAGRRNQCLSSGVFLPLSAAEQVSLHHRLAGTADSSNLFADYSISELHHHSQYGVPFHLHAPAGTPAESCQRVMDVIQRHQHTATESSLMAYVVVLLQQSPIVFPVVITSAEDSDHLVLTAYAVRNSDFLTAFISLAHHEGPHAPTDSLLSSFNAWLAIGEAKSSDDEPPTAMRVPQLFPEGTPAITYMDFIHHLQHVRHDLSSLWMNFFSTNALPSRATVSFTAIGSALSSMVDATTFTPPQVEALHGLADDAGQVRSKVPSAMTCNVRVVEGAAGSGKSTLISAAGLLRGQQMVDSRQEQQRSQQTPIRQCKDSLLTTLTSLESCESFDDVSSEHLSSLVLSATSYMEQLSKLSTGVKNCGAPLMLRSVDSAAETPEVLSLGGSTPPPPWMQANAFSSATDVLEASVVRVSNAPLAKALSQQLQRLVKVCECCSIALSCHQRASEDPEAPAEPIYSSLLPFLMRRSDLDDTVQAAVERDVDWRTYVSETLWSAVSFSIADSVRHSGADHNEEPSPYWSSPERPSAPFSPVDSGHSTALSSLTVDQAAGWHAVYREKQTQFLQEVFVAAQQEIRSIFHRYEDLLFSVASVFQTTRSSVITASARDSLRYSVGFLPFLWRWKPPHLLLDDMDGLGNAFFLCLPEASTVTASLSSGIPQQVYDPSASPVILKDLLRSMQRNSAARTTILREAHRCGREEVTAVLSMWCGSDTTASKSTDVSPLPGFASRSAVEAWTHGLLASQSVEGDIKAAEALCKEFDQHASRNTQVHVFFPFPSDLRRAESLMCMAPQSKCSLVSSSFLNIASSKRVNTDVAIVCLSGLYARMAGRTGSCWWLAPEAQSGGLLEQRLSSWLWWVTSRARRGVILIGARSLFTRLPLLRDTERFILEQRRSETDPFWLPDSVGCAVMAFQCHQHVKCRRIATITAANHSDVQISLHGSLKCESYCSLPYENCDTDFHACLRPCHAGERDDAAHHQCPYFCAKELPCGHPCEALCWCRGSSGADCPPCQVTCLTQLSCGQWAISGASMESGVFAIQRAFFAHFESRKCGEAHSPCEIAVRSSCHRCGSDYTVPCWLFSEEQRRRNVADDNFNLEPMECHGCVALVNKVCESLGLPLLPLPDSHITEFAASPPVLPECLQGNAAAMENLQALFARETHRAALLQKKEALELSSSRGGAENSWHASLQAEYLKNVSALEEEKKKRQQVVEEAELKLLQQLRSACDAQININIQLDAVMPLLVSEAHDEYSRQLQASES